MKEKNNISNNSGSDIFPNTTDIVKSEYNQALGRNSNHMKMENIGKC